MNTKFNISKEQLEYYIANNYTQQEVANIHGCTIWTVINRVKQYGLKFRGRAYQQKNDNVAKREDVRKKISKAVSKQWQDGAYINRRNGMLGKVMANNPNFTFGKASFREKALYYHSTHCLMCGRDDTKIDIHHVDEKRKNMLLTNLQPLCVRCHQKYHFASKKQPFCSITKLFEFEAGHFIPEHFGDCKYVHGHSYKLEITVTGRIHPETGVVIDFKTLSTAVKKLIIEPLDHGFINDYLEMPTAENMLLWIWKALSLDIKGLTRIKLYETSGSYAEISAKEVLELARRGAFEAEWFNKSSTEEGE